jgi:hypothetical protein
VARSQPPFQKRQSVVPSVRHAEVDIALLMAVHKDCYSAIDLTQQEGDNEASRARNKGAWIDPHGYDAGKKIKGKKRHILVDAQGLLLHALVHSADIQDREGGVLVMATLFGLHPFC